MCVFSQSFREGREPLTNIKEEDADDEEEEETAKPSKRLRAKKEKPASKQGSTQVSATTATEKKAVGVDCGEELVPFFDKVGQKMAIEKYRNLIQKVRYLFDKEYIKQYHADKVKLFEDDKELSVHGDVDNSDFERESATFAQNKVEELERDIQERSQSQERRLLRSVRGKLRVITGDSQRFKPGEKKEVSDSDSDSDAPLVAAPFPIKLRERKQSKQVGKTTPKSATASTSATEKPGDGGEASPSEEEEWTPMKVKKRKRKPTTPPKSATGKPGDGGEASPSEEQGRTPIKSKKPKRTRKSTPVKEESATSEEEGKHAKSTAKTEKAKKPPVTAQTSETEKKSSQSATGQHRKGDSDKSDTSSAEDEKLTKSPEAKKPVPSTHPTSSPTAEKPLSSTDPTTTASPTKPKGSGKSSGAEKPLPSTDQTTTASPTVKPEGSGKTEQEVLDYIDNLANTYIEDSDDQESLLSLPNGEYFRLVFSPACVNDKKVEKLHERTLNVAKAFVKGTMDEAAVRDQLQEIYILDIGDQNTLLPYADLHRLVCEPPSSDLSTYAKGLKIAKDILRRMTKKPTTVSSTTPTTPDKMEPLPATKKVTVSPTTPTKPDNKELSPRHQPLSATKEGEETPSQYLPVLSTTEQVEDEQVDKHLGETPHTAVAPAEETSRSATRNVSETLEHAVPSAVEIAASESLLVLSEQSENATARELWTKVKEREKEEKQQMGTRSGSGSDTSMDEAGNIEQVSDADEVQKKDEEELSDNGSVNTQADVIDSCKSDSVVSHSDSEEKSGEKEGSDHEGEEQEDDEEEDDEEEVDDDEEGKDEPPLRKRPRPDDDDDDDDGRLKPTHDTPKNRKGHQREEKEGQRHHGEEGRQRQPGQKTSPKKTTQKSTNRRRWVQKKPPSLPDLPTASVSLKVNKWLDGVNPEATPEPEGKPNRMQLIHQNSSPLQKVHDNTISEVRAIKREMEITGKNVDILIQYSENAKRPVKLYDVDMDKAELTVRYYENFPQGSKKWRLDSAKETFRENFSSFIQKLTGERMVHCGRNVDKDVTFHFQ